MQSLVLFPWSSLLFLMNLLRNCIGLGLLILGKLDMGNHLKNAFRVEPTVWARYLTMLDMATVTAGFSTASGKYMMFMARVKLKSPRLQKWA